jgi:hypothetical protein
MPQPTLERTPVVLPSRRSAAEIVNSTLDRICTHFGRLVYLARCRESDGRYTHHGLQLTHRSAEVHTALLIAHDRHFRRWMNLGPDAQYEDLSIYMYSLNVKRVLKAWRDSEPWQVMTAPTADAEERRLFASDFRRLLELLEI